MPQYRLSVDIETTPDQMRGIVDNLRVFTVHNLKVVQFSEQDVTFALTGSDRELPVDQSVPHSDGSSEPPSLTLLGPISP